MFAGIGGFDLAAATVKPVTLTEGQISKGGQNPPNMSTKRPEPPQGSGGKGTDTTPLRYVAWAVFNPLGGLCAIETGELSAKCEQLMYPGCTVEPVTFIRDKKQQEGT